MKFYKVKVTVESEIELGIQAEDEISAHQEARKIALDKYSGKSRVSQIELTLNSDSEFQVGSKVRHKIFGVGIINNLIAVNNCGGESGWRATIEFEDKGEKDIVILPGTKFLEPLSV
ncbi:hypothetical protein BIT28_16175 [Photobacterium proteolyticum]|uniref:Uncharacterized protein n=1 Tax=Photobacterium proteolyticum TaxID=1903952 RepID=A0A1Q9GJL9_9GAMM|nr:hypothetical protein [Photobacterium proteolyticum]OLQ74701.1 hypothetical protein BIT28_16175 [Photobacterium proteolyticum]